jgi:hypothetical protein
MPAKSLKEMRIRKAKSGGHIIEHHFEHPEHHQMEEHTSGNAMDLAKHVVQHMGGDEEQAESASAQGGE